MLLAMAVCTFIVGVLTGWLAARQFGPTASLARPEEQTNQTTETSSSHSQPMETTMPDNSRQVGTPAAGSQMQRRRRMLAENRQYHIRPGSTSSSCRHAGLAVSATNQCSWAVRCSDCQLRLSVWWKTGEDHNSMSHIDLLNIAKDIVY